MRRFTLSTTLIIACLAALGTGMARPAMAAAIYYVSPTGNDTNNGSISAPWRTLQKAAATMVAGDKVWIQDGDYAGGIVQSRAGTASAPITYAAVNPGHVIVHGEQTTNTDAFYITQANYITVDGITVRQANRAGIRVSLSNSVTIRRCALLNNTKWGIFTDYSDDLLLEYNECAGSAVEHGIYVSNSGDRPIIQFNIVHDNNASGIQINADPALLDPSQGTRGDGITDSAVVQSNTVYNNETAGGAAINLASVRNSRIVNNLLYNNKAGGISGWDDGDGIQWGSKNNTVLHNTVHFQPGIGRWCVSFKNGSTGNVVQNNILSGGGHGGLEIDNDSSISSDYNLLRWAGSTTVATNEDTAVFYSLAAWRSATGNDLHSVNADAQFVSAAAAPYDFHLLSGSPALDSGVDRPDVTVDLDGVTRPQNARWDMGSYEKASGPTAPAAPTGLTARGGVGQVTLTWNSSAGATSYTVYRRSGTGSYAPLASGTGTSYTDTAVTNGTAYFYVVTASNAIGESAVSSEVSATPLAVPFPPTNLAATGGRRSVALSWVQSPSPSITQNQIYRATSASGLFTLVATVSARTSYTDSGLSRAVTYYYYVTAVNVNGTESPPSNQASARTR